MKFLNPEDAFNYLGTFMNFEKVNKQTIRDYRLSRMKTLLSHFGEPQRDIKLIHIAGSKGKGSTGILIASGLESLGFKTGLYTSPHVSSYRERITEAGTFFSDKEYIKAAEEIVSKLDTFAVDEETGTSEPTTFELLTLMAFIIFRNTGCTWGVIETGIGGRLDATNVITPEASIITPIETEHTDILGKTLDKIAFEKAGIIKKGIPVFTAPQKEVALRVIKRKADSESAPLFRVEEIFSDIISIQDGKENKIQLIKRDGAKTGFTISLPGEIQASNAALAWLVLEKLFTPASGTFKTGSFAGDVLRQFGKKTLPGRFEIVEKGQTFIFDGAHTPESTRHMMGTYENIFGRKGILIFGAVAGKDFRGMAEILIPYFDRIIISTPGTFKESDPETVWAVFRGLRQDTILIKDPEEAYRRALILVKNGQAKGPILTAGSFYMVSKIRSLVV